MKILVTGSAGFIGSELCIKLLDMGFAVFGIDNHNSYYDTNLKEARLQRHIDHKNYFHDRIDIADHSALKKIFKNFNPDCVVNLAAQAGVRYSIENPHAYVNSNIVGFINILENCRHLGVKHLVYASSSSVYGANTVLPFSTDHNVDHPLSLYAASKKSNELMAHTYSHLFSLPTTGLRFFTVYGPWGRPDMALFKFTNSMLKNQKIQLFNFGKHKRDFTYIDDIIEGIVRVVKKPAEIDKQWSSKNPSPGSSFVPWRIYNIGNNNPVHLEDFISALEDALGVSAKKEYMPIQPGDVPDTFADIRDLSEDFGYRPTTDVTEGISRFVNWYKNFYEL